MIFRNSQRNKQDDVDTIRKFSCCSISRDCWKKKISHYGGVAQLGEHLPCKQGVKGSIPFISTIGRKTENVVHKELDDRSKVDLGCAKHKGS